MSGIVPTPTDRKVAALSHLGIPLYGLLLPLALYIGSESNPFRRSHARQAFSLQCVVFIPYVVLFVLMAFGVVSPIALLVMLGVGLILEVPNVVRAAKGRPPWRVIPIDILRGTGDPPGSPEVEGPPA